MIRMLIELIILILGIPAGLLIAWMANDELKKGRKWFRMLVILSLVLALLFWIYGTGYIALTFAFIAIVSFVSVVRAK